MNQNNQLTVSRDSTQQLTPSTRFTNTILKEFGQNAAGECRITGYQRQLVQGYFVCIDRALKKAEEERVRKNQNNKNHQYDNNLPIEWKNINLPDLALDLVHYARMGLDMLQPNMLFPIPYKNNKHNRYDITLMEGYNGKRYIAEKYALDVPRDVTVEVVYSTDNFIPIKKSRGVECESYVFEITNPFDRGEIKGGFAYLEFDDRRKNKIITMSMADINKRKPEYASANFWGGKQMAWENGKQVEVEKEGWLDEMVRKTLIREAYSAKHLPRDPQKIDENYQYLREREAAAAEAEVLNTIDDNANTTPIEIPESFGIDPDTGEVTTPADIIDEDDLP